jgi:pimeloyl-ACP methyl ester carboxylesterase
MTQNGHYAPVNGLQMYYEIHGTGKPLVLLHGGMTTIGDFSIVIPYLAQTRQVIAFERQGHGHTADIDRSFTLEQMADDTDALLRHLGIDSADFFGYSTGGSVALATAIQYPERVDKLVLASTIYNAEGYYPEIMAGLRQSTAEAMPEIMREMYEQVAPRPQDWATLVTKSVAAVATFQGWQPEELRAIRAPTLIMAGDGDIVRPEHSVEMYRLIPSAKLAILPDTDHIGILFQRTDWLCSMITGFLEEASS